MIILKTICVSTWRDESTFSLYIAFPINVFQPSFCFSGGLPKIPLDFLGQLTPHFIFILFNSHFNFYPTVPWIFMTELTLGNFMLCMRLDWTNLRPLHKEVAKLWCINCDDTGVPAIVL